jgi:hypothetical protein
MLMESAAVSSPLVHSFDEDEEEPLHIVKRDHVYQAAKKDQAKEHLSYDPVRNRLPTYLISPSSDSSRDFLSTFEDEEEDRPRLLRRDLVPSVVNRQLKKRGPAIDHTTSPFYSECHSLIKRSVETNNTDSSHTILVGDEVLKWSLWVQDSGKQIVAIFRNGARKLHHRVIKAVADAWDFVHVILLRIGIRLEVGRSFFRF